MNVAIIPARGGSKRIPRKNIKDFNGKPIIAYSIEAAIKTSIFDQVIVTTDDEEIADIAIQYGASCPFSRPAELADDYATTVPVINHALGWVEDNIGMVKNACCLYATAPFLTPDALKQAYSILVSEDVRGYVFSATSFPFPIQRAFAVEPDGYVRMFNPENYNKRSQDFDEAYQDAGQFYWGKREAYLEEKIFFSADSKAFLLPRYLVQDIDTAEDWKRAEVMYQALVLNGDL